MGSDGLELVGKTRFISPGTESVSDVDASTGRKGQGRRRRKAKERRRGEGGRGGRQGDEGKGSGPRDLIQDESVREN